MYNKDDVKKMITSITREEGSAEYTDAYGNLHNINDDIEQAEKDVAAILAKKGRDSSTMTFRWEQDLLDLAKQIADIKGLKYQTYLKTLMKAGLAKDAKELGLI